MLKVYAKLEGHSTMSGKTCLRLVEILGLPVSHIDLWYNNSSRID